MLLKLVTLLFLFSLIIKKSIELSTEGNWWSILLEPIKLSVQWLTIPNLLNVSWQSDFSCNVFSVSVVFDLQESDVVTVFNKVANSLISFFRTTALTAPYRLIS